MNLYQAHPWHGISIGKEAPNIVNAFIEIVPTDTIKYEIDKESGFLKVDRPQKFSNIVPALYGFIPQTYCDTEVASLASMSAGETVEHGDKDPLDICIFSERSIPHGGIIVKVKPIGGIRLLDKGEADDKIIAVIEGDVYSSWNDISDCPASMLTRLKHYFLTYKNMPGEKEVCRIANVYGKDEALKVIEASVRDYGNYKLSLKSEEKS